MLRGSSGSRPTSRRRDPIFGSFQSSLEKTRVTPSESGVGRIFLSSAKLSCRLPKVTLRPNIGRIPLVTNSSCRPIRGVYHPSRWKTAGLPDCFGKVSCASQTFVLLEQTLANPEREQLKNPFGKARPAVRAEAYSFCN